MISNKSINEKHIPLFAIIGYKNENGSYGDIKYHPIKKNKIQAEIPFTNDCLNDLKELAGSLKAKSNQNLSFKGLIPNNIIFFNKKDVIWTTEPTRKYLYFKKNLKIKNGYYSLPKLLFSFKNKVLNVFALKNNEKVNENSKLYNAPFFNTYADGSVCMGNVQISIDNFNYIEDAIEFLEAGFFKSVFTHTNHNKIIKGNITEYYLNKISFTNDILLESSSKQIKNLLN
jgi:PRTRC genetic system protein B